MEANSKLETSRSTAQLAGPSIAGVLVQIFSAPYVILGDVLGYFGSATFLSTIR
ncbi:MAG: MFS transporter, partial [Thaumarchaeota archaeon]